MDDKAASGLAADGNKAPKQKKKRTGKVLILLALALLFAPFALLLPLLMLMSGGTGAEFDFGCWESGMDGSIEPEPVLPPMEGVDPNLLPPEAVNALTAYYPWDQLVDTCNSVSGGGLAAVGTIGQGLSELPKAPFGGGANQNVPAHTLAFAQAIHAHFGNPISSLSRPGATVKGGAPSDHARGLAIDVAVSPNCDAKGDLINSWVHQAHREGIIKIKYTIWCDKIFFAVNGFAPTTYTGAKDSSASQHHLDHVHVSLAG